MNIFFHNLIETFLNNPLWQSIWLLGFLVSIINFLFLKDKKFIWWTLVASFFWWMHFYYIWALAASYINFFDVIKNWFALKYERNKNWMYIFIFSYFLIWVYTFLNFNISTLSIWELNYLSLFPTFSSLFSTFLVFKTRWIFMKAWFLFVVFSWLIYNISYWSIGWVMTDWSLFIAWIIWIIKDYKNSKN